MPLGEAEVFDALGPGGFGPLVAAFYRRVRADDLLGPMYPPGEWAQAEWRLRAFLDQRFGGPMAYSERRGHPRLRMRHAPFAIGEPERDRWLALMAAAMEEVAVSDAVTEVVAPFFLMVAEGMRNR
ncbi:globin [Phycisphaera mikurensis]|uniref:2-on-2 hemoglobin n=1 Tax=Phycisphaera mikurensis (strain NBRC 102666 / KCTC 22515 / FYK2301M01) TaxID=1142394 RepID=I0IB02_PHYMF|nr:globin [Phycisphaera mikurensis]MBB6442588.1 hemoglobin [Phycisphaera mikurensis]BAM02440.1 2-on-2 hemoglobin [Phycisphaera mikurensis NBRC 102666]